MKWFISLVRIILFRLTALKFALGVVIGMAFSMAVILSTMGLMDGFENALKEGLKKSQGDISLSQEGNFFSWEGEIQKTLAEQGVSEISPVVKSHAFLLTKDSTQGVLVQGISPLAFYRVTGLKINLEQGGIVIGKELAKKFYLSKGDNVALVYAVGESVVVRRYIVSDVVHHGFYQKDLRQVFLPLEDMQEALNLKKQINKISFNLPSNNNDWDAIRLFAVKLADLLGPEFTTSPYWEEYSVLFKAVKEQKVVIAFMLGLIVIVSIFNILAFVIFLGEKYAREIFLFCVLGMSRLRLGIAWPGIIVFLWGVSCLLSVVFVKIFDGILGYWTLFQLPKEIYYFGRLRLHLESEHYMLIFFLILAWLMIISLGIVWRYRKHSLLKGLRRAIV